MKPHKNITSVPPEQYREIHLEWERIMAAGTDTVQAQMVLAYMTSIANMKKMGKNRLYRELIRIPTIGHRTAVKIVNHFKKR